jgi:hypothetical protein
MMELLKQTTMVCIDTPAARCLNKALSVRCISFFYIRVSFAKSSYISTLYCRDKN